MKTFQKYCLSLVGVTVLIIYLISTTNKTDDLPSKCGRYPTEADILIDNVMWQTLKNPNGLLFLMNAYLDLRWNKTVVINAIGAALNLTTENIYCQYWFDGRNEPTVVQASKFQSLWRFSRFGRINLKKAPYLISCPLGTDKKTPRSVSVTLNRCDNAENNLVIIDNQPPNGVKKKFGICTKQFTFKLREHAIKFVEWAEMMRLLGAEKIHTYNRFFHPELLEITKFYEKQDFIEIQPFMEPSTISNSHLHNLQSILLELTVINDCFYRVRNLYEYIAILDPDEIFLPVQENDRNWHDLLKNFEKFPKKDAYAVQSVSYPPRQSEVLDFIPEYYYMLQHVERSVLFKNIPGPVFNCKSFVNPDGVTVAYTHGAELCSDNECEVLYVSNNISQVSHYRDKLKQKSDNETMLDIKIWKFKDELIEGVEKILAATKFNPILDEK